MNFFYENLIAGGAFKTLLYGVGITLFLTIGAMILGTIVGMVLCVLSRGRFRAARAISGAFSAIVGGIPMLMFLLFFYYVIFAPFRIGALTTAIVAFGLKVSVTIGKIMNSALDSVDSAQLKAARTLGFTALGAFFCITLPQAVSFGRDLYRNAALELLQATTIAGYITITELMRVVNSMQARTGQPFISMLIGILLYLLLAVVINMTFRFTGNRQKRAGA
jgi:polar amino acid transport system permease protein/polar amino acid transport system substrate-binding protein